MCVFVFFGFSLLLRLYLSVLAHLRTNFSTNNKMSRSLQVSLV